MTPETAQKIAAIGRVIDPVKTGDVYAPIHAQVPQDGISVTRDIAYGPADRNLLDVWTAKYAKGPLPVLIFVHGGGFIGGNKSTAGSPFYDNVPLWAARHGMVGVNITYRLAPAAPFPAGAADVGEAVRWTVDNIARFGGDPSRIFLMGHSAGATHVATYAAMPQFHGGRDIQIAGLILTSGIYDVAAFPMNDNFRAYFGSDASLYPSRSPIDGLRTLPIPSMIAYAELEPPPFITQFETLAKAMDKAPGGKPQTVRLDSHSHLSLGYAIGTDDTSLTGPILDFVASVK